MAVDVLQLDRDVLASLSDQAGEPTWMREFRIKAWESYEQLPMPAWEKSDVRRRKWAEFSPLMAKPTGTDDDLTGVPAGLRPSDGEQPFVWLQDGYAGAVQGRTKLPEGVVFTDLATAIREHGDLVQQYLAKVVATDEHKLLALHYALLRGGVFLYVPRNVAVEVPLQSLYTATEKGEGLFSHTLIIAEPGSDLTYIEACFGVGDLKNQLNSNVIEAVVGQNARVRIQTVTELPRALTNVVTRRATVGRDGRVEWTAGELSDGFTVGHFTSILEGSGASGDAKTVLVGSGRQHIDMTATMKHLGDHSESNMVARGVLLGRSEAVFRAVTEIEDGAAAASGEQEERLLTLSSNCRADAIPMLLINENEVERCGHAASVGQVNPEQLYYLCSRGIPEAQAKQLIVWGFIDPVIDEIASSPVQDAIRSLIERKMS